MLVSQQTLLAILIPGIVSMLCLPVSMLAAQTPNNTSQLAAEAAPSGRVAKTRERSKLAETEVANSEKIAITNVNIVPMGGAEVIKNKAVLIEAGTIKAIVPYEDMMQVAGIQKIDGGNGYLVPGLIDTHVHHQTNVDYRNYICQGVTTVMGLGQGRSLDEFIEIRQQIVDDKMIGPHIYTTGNTIANHIQINDPELARKFVRSLKQRKLDYVKIYNNISKDVFDAVVEEANQIGLSVFGHIPRNIPVEYSIANGINVIAHAEELYFTWGEGPRDQQLSSFEGSQIPDLTRAQHVIDLMKEHDVALIANLHFTFAQMKFWENETWVLNDPESQYTHAKILSNWSKYNSSQRPNATKRSLRERIKYAYIHELTYRAQRSGVLVVAGTDAPLPGEFPGKSIHYELREFIKTGFSPLESLATATDSAGILIRKFVDPEAKLGRIAPGYQADLVLVDKNPLEDIRNLADIRGVMVDGKWYDWQTIDAMRTQIADAAKQSKNERSD